MEALATAEQGATAETFAGASQQPHPSILSIPQRVLLPAPMGLLMIPHFSSSVWWRERIDLYEHLFCHLLVEISELKHWELLRRDYTYHRWTRRGLWEEDTRKDSWGQGHKEGLFLPSPCLPVWFQTAQAFLFGGTLVIGVEREERFESEKVSWLLSAK